MHTAAALLAVETRKLNVSNLWIYPVYFSMFRYEYCFYVAGKGDLVGCDISMWLSEKNGGSAVGPGAGTGVDPIVKSSCDVKALTYCDLKSVNVVGLVEVLRLYPEYQQEFAHDIQHDLTYNIREGYEAEVSTTHSYNSNTRLINDHSMSQVKSKDWKKFLYWMSS